MLYTSDLTPHELKQQRLAQHCFWDETSHTLWIDCRHLFPELGVVRLPGWDHLMMSSADIPDYPEGLRVLEWSNFSQLSYWRKQIPKWVQESCALFSSHQLNMLHYAAKYPQMLELLDHAPMLVWRLMRSDLTEPEIAALLSGKRQHLVSQVGWPDKAEAVKFLRNLRLRRINDKMIEQVEICLMDDQRLTALQALPRINSMALSLASVFPVLIGSRLHHALAQLPCRPMQCQSMVALLQDAYALAEWLALSRTEMDQIGQCRYLVEVTEHYQNWLATGLELGCDCHHSEDEVSLMEHMASKLSDNPQWMSSRQDWNSLSQLQHHAWWLDRGKSNRHLVAWMDAEGVWAALIEHQDLAATIIRVRGEKNKLPGAKQLTELHLWLATATL